VRLYSRPGHDLTKRFPLIVEALARLRSRSCVIDGEAVACDDNGIALFDLIRHHRASDSVFLYAFDLIELNADDLRRDPLQVRKATLASNPVRLGLVASLNRPGGNATGVNTLLQEMESKRLGLVRELVPTGALIAVLLNPSNANFQTQLQDVTDAARTVSQQIRVLNASNERDIHAAFTTLSKSRPAALLVGGDPFLNTRREQLVTLANHYAIPAIYDQPEFAAAGGLMIELDRGLDGKLARLCAP
jgi:ABC transporter substrate binding protein/ATP dependent DNA ligase domain